MSANPTESAGERSSTPRTEQIVERGLASMKAAGMNTQRVYDACAAFVKELGEHAIAQERELTAARQRIEGLEAELRADKELVTQRNAISVILMDDSASLLELLLNSHDAHSFWAQVDEYIRTHPEEMADCDDDDDDDDSATRHLKEKS